MALFRLIAAEWLRRAGMDPFFIVKMKVNELAIREVAKAAYGGDGEEACNSAAAGMANSPVHDKIADLARAIVEEASRQRKAAGE